MFNGGYAQIYDSSASSVFAPAIPVNADLTSEVETAVIDRFDKELNHLNLAVAIQAVTTGNTAGDNLVITAVVKHCDTEGGTYEDFETKVIEHASGAAGTANLVASVPLKLLGTKQFVKLGITVAPDGQTLTSAVGSGVFNLWPEKGWPDDAYDKDGYSVE